MTAGFSALRAQHLAAFTTTNYTQDGVVIATGGPYSFIVPGGVYQLRANVAGPGAGGAGGFATAGGGGGGGGSGLCRFNELLDVTPGETVVVAVPSGGIGGAIGSNGGNATGPTSISSPTLGTRNYSIGNGGGAGAATNGGSGGAGAGLISGSTGGAGAGPLASVTGTTPLQVRCGGGIACGGSAGGAVNFAGGSSPYAGGNTVNLTTNGGALQASNGGGGNGGSTPFGTGTPGIGGSQTGPVAATSPATTNYGAGGGGGAGNQAGAAGAAGYVEFIWEA